MSDTLHIDAALTQQLRQEYAGKPLDEASVNPDPFLQFNSWFEEAMKSQIPLANAMTLATATKEGKPSARIVLLKEVRAGEFVFYTSYLSRKSRELRDNPEASLLFYWAPLDRQIRIEGTIGKTTDEESTAYFQTRPRGSQIGAHASQQSAVLGGRALLEQRFKQVEDEFKDKDVPRPKYWGGFCVKPSWMEFWQGRESRLHDRVSFTLQANGGWKIERLYP